MFFLYRMVKMALKSKSASVNENIALKDINVMCVLY